MSDRTKVLSTHFLRRAARRREREIEAALRSRHDEEGMLVEGEARLLRDVPDWARGVRVEKAGPLQWAVVATEHQGH